MKLIKPDINLHNSFNHEIMELSETSSEAGILFEFKLADRLKERGLSVRKTAELTGLRVATISELMTGKKANVNLHHILVLMLALRISKITDLVDIEIPENLSELLNKDSNLWVQLGTVPPEIESIIEYKKLAKKESC